MELSDIEIGSKLEIEAADQMTADNRQVFTSQFEWLEEENSAVIAAPIYEGKIIPLETGTLIDVYFIGKKRKMVDLFTFRAMITGRSIADNLHILLIEKLGEIVRIQRRSYYRLDLLLEVRYRVISATNKEYGTETPYKRTLATDLSGGGINLVIEEKLEKGSLIECEISRGEQEIIRFIGKTVRCERMMAESRYRYSVGIEFADISDINRERLIRFIFTEQRKLIKKGMD